MVYGTEPTGEEEAAWCSACGALWAQSYFGWGWHHPLADRTAPTLVNILREAREAAAPPDDAKQLLAQAEQELKRKPLNHLAATFIQTGRSLLNNRLIRGLVLRVVAEEDATKDAGALGVVYIRKGCLEGADELREALDDVEEDIAKAEEIAKHQTH
jgi:hypothetical protein